MFLDDLIVLTGNAAGFPPVCSSQRSVAFMRRRRSSIPLWIRRGRKCRSCRVRNSGGSFLRCSETLFMPGAAGSETASSAHPYICRATDTTKPRVAVDIDEVLGSFLATLNTFCKDEYHDYHDLEEFVVYDFKQIWKCSQEEANQRVHQFFQSRYFNKGIPRIPGSAPALMRLASAYDLVVVTSRQHAIRQPTLEWLQSHFPDLFSEVHFGNHYALRGSARPKADICREIGAGVLIDDNPQYALECAEQGIEVLLFDWNLSYAWSKMPHGPTHPLIARVRDWGEVEAVLWSRIPQQKLPAK